MRGILLVAALLYFLPFFVRDTDFQMIAGLHPEASA